MTKPSVGLMISDAIGQLESIRENHGEVEVVIYSRRLKKSLQTPRVYYDEDDKEAYFDSYDE